MARYKGKEYTVKKVATKRVVLIKDDGLLIVARHLVELTKKEKEAMHLIRCHRCGKLKEPSQFSKLKPVWCTWCITCQNTPIGDMPK